ADRTAAAVARGGDRDRAPRPRGGGVCGAPGGRSRGPRGACHPLAAAAWGGGMTFARPWLLLLLLLPVAWWWWRRNRKSAGTGFSDLRLLQLVRERAWLARIPTWCRLLAFAAWVLAASGPRVGGSQVEMKKEGIAIVIAIDISSSMLAEDFAPSNRMEVA